MIAAVPARSSAALTQVQRDLINMHDVVGWVHAALKRQGVSEAAAVPTARFVEDLNLDSLDMAELLMWAEDDFGEIDDEDAEGVRTVEDAVKLLRRVWADAQGQPSQKAEADHVSS